MILRSVLRIEMMWCVPTWLRCERTGKRCERDNRKVNRLARGNASHDVSWLQIPAHHTTAVRFVERIGHLPPVFQYLFERQRPLPYPIKEFIGIRSDHRIATVRSDKSTVQGVLDSTRLVRFNQNCFFMWRNCAARGAYCQASSSVSRFRSPPA